MKHYKFVVPGKAIGKERPRLGRNGVAFTPKKTQDYEALVKKCFLEQNEEPDPIETKNVSFVLRAYLPNKVHADLDNICKSAQDGLNKVAYLDDKQIKHIEGFLFYDKINPRLEIEIIEREEI